MRRGETVAERLTRAVAVEAEQEGYDAHWDKPIAELNPCVREFQDLTIRKWEEHLAKAQRRGAPLPRAEELRD